MTTPIATLSPAQLSSRTTGNALLPEEHLDKRTGEYRRFRDVYERLGAEARTERERLHAKVASIIAVQLERLGPLIVSGEATPEEREEFLRWTRAFRGHCGGRAEAEEQITDDQIVQAFEAGRSGADPAPSKEEMVTRRYLRERDATDRLRQGMDGATADPIEAMKRYVEEMKTIRVETDDED